jgi:DhnA family fructose-bisphosphate aldolase class Ia
MIFSKVSPMILLGKHPEHEVLQHCSALVENCQKFGVVLTSPQRTVWRKTNSQRIVQSWG